jgi:hypothetical protein
VDPVSIKSYLGSIIEKQIEGLNKPIPFDFFLKGQQGDQIVRIFANWAIV